MITINQVTEEDPTGNRKRIVYMKGAAERIIARCTNILNKEGEKVPLTDEIRAAVMRQQEDFGRAGQRVLACAQRFLEDPAQLTEDYTFSSTEDGHGESRFNFPVDGLTLLGLLAIMDPPRPEVAGAIQRCRTAGARGDGNWRSSVHCGGN